MAGLQIEKLEKCPNYFSSWLIESKINPDEKLTMSLTKELYRCIGCPVKKDEDSETDGSSDESEMSEKDVQENESMMTLQKPMGPLVEAFYSVRIGNATLAQKNIAWVQEEMDSHFSCTDHLKEYVRGYEYLMHLLQIHITIVEKKSQETEDKLDETMELYENFTDKEKSIVAMGRWMLEESMFQEKYIPPGQPVTRLLEMSKLDPTYWVWHYLLCSRMRSFRRTVRGTKPSEAEINAITSSVKFAPDFFKRMCISGVCQCLAEIISWNWYNNRFGDTSVSMGDLFFPDAYTAIDYIKSQSGVKPGGEPQMIKALKNMCFGEIIRYGEIFSTILPPVFRDYEMARICFQICLLMFPTDSKSNHKMGIIWLTGFKDIDKAVMYLRRSIEKRSCNFPALIDLTRVLLSSVNKYDAILEELFSSTFSTQNVTWPEKQYSALKFFEGCYHFLKNEIEKAVDCWMLVLPESGNGFQNDFTCIKAAAKRYLWSQETIDGLSKERILSRIKSTMDSEKNEIRKLLLRIEQEMTDKPNSKPQHARNNFHMGNVRSSIPSVGPFHAYQRNMPNEADEDNCWRRKDTSRPQQNYESEQRQQRHFSPAGSSNTYNRNRNKSWNNRSPSPENWRS